jgi:hypothetical protein
VVDDHSCLVRAIHDLVHRSRDARGAGALASVMVMG